MNRRMVVAALVAGAVVGLAYWLLVRTLGLDDWPPPITLAAVAFFSSFAGAWNKSVTERNPSAGWRERLLPWPGWMVLAALIAVLVPVAAVTAENPSSCPRTASRRPSGWCTPEREGRPRVR